VIEKSPEVQLLASYVEKKSYHFFPLQYIYHAGVSNSDTTVSVFVCH
jgi:hypothetical protein